MLPSFGIKSEGYLDFWNFFLEKLINKLFVCLSDLLWNRVFRNDSTLIHVTTVASSFKVLCATARHSHDVIKTVLVNVILSLCESLNHQLRFTIRLNVNLIDYLYTDCCIF